MKRHTLLATVLTVTSWQSAICETEKPGSPKQIWGSPFEGAAISLRPSATQYKLGQQIELELRFRNVSGKEVTLLYSGFQHSCKVALFHRDGRPVAACTAAGRPETPTAGRMPPSFSTQAMVLAPGEIGTGFHVITLNPLFDIAVEGTYIAVVMYCPRSWADGFAISNLAKFEVSAGENKSPSAPEPNEARRDDGS